MYYINCFFIYSIIGFLIETFLLKKADSGILTGPWVIMYGLGYLIIITIHYYLNKFKLKKIQEVLLLFITSAFLITILELLGGLLIEKIFHITFWNYSHMRFNLGKYIALEVSFLWGIGSILLIYIIKPILDKIINKIPKIISYIFVLAFIIDIIFTIMKKL